MKCSSNSTGLVETGRRLKASRDAWDEWDKNQSAETQSSGSVQHVVVNHPTVEAPEHLPRTNESRSGAVPRSGVGGGRGGVRGVVNYHKVALEDESHRQKRSFQSRVSKSSEAHSEAK